MKEQLEELRKLNENIARLADAVAVRPDPSVFDRGSAFRATSLNGRLALRRISLPDRISFRELKGIDSIIRSVRLNTEQFLNGLACNNVLLYGPRGTGKSSVVKALLNAYARQGLRMIEMSKQALLCIGEISALVESRPERYIIFCDDLSFEEDETLFREIKTLLEGGLEQHPGNLLVYATSNRRHLMPERMEDNLSVASSGELHPSETLEERLSLSDRFGLRLGFDLFSADDYLMIVENYALLRKLRIPHDRLRSKAMEWSISHGSFSGRTARQFIDDLEGTIKLKRGKARKRLFVPK